MPPLVTRLRPLHESSTLPFGTWLIPLQCNPFSRQIESYSSTSSSFLSSSFTLPLPLHETEHFFVFLILPQNLNALFSSVLWMSVRRHQL